MILQLQNVSTAFLASFSTAKQNIAASRKAVHNFNIDIVDSTFYAQNVLFPNFPSV